MRYTATFILRRRHSKDSRDGVVREHSFAVQASFPIAIFIYPKILRIMYRSKKNGIVITVRARNHVFFMTMNREGSNSWFRDEAFAGIGGFLVGRDAL